MSEYQHYEFQAVDRPLNDKEMNELRSFSTRAEITPHSFTNDYSWGSFKGDEDRWMEKYFDGFLYYANWGTHILKLRLPSILLDFKTARSYCSGDHFSVRLSGDKVILDFLSESEDGGDWEEDLRLTPFLSLRTDLSRGDLRCLYLGWLSGLQSDEVDVEEVEPSIPPDLQNLNPALANFADFLRIDPDLIDAAAINSPTLEDITPSIADLRTWIATLSINERDDLLANILVGSMQSDQTAALQQVSRFTKIWQTLRGDKKAKIKPRTVGELLKKADLVRQNRERLQAEKKAAELAEKQRLQKIAREKRLNEIVGQEPILWAQIESLASEKKAKSYDKAVELLTDLYDLAARTKASDFHLKLKNLRENHSPKSSFIERLRIFS